MDIPKVTYIDTFSHTDGLSNHIRGGNGYNNIHPQSGMGGSDYMIGYDNNVPDPAPPHPQIQYIEKDVTCPDVFEHIQACELCQKFFNKDTTLYVLAIVVLSIIVAFFLKKHLKF